MNLQESIRNDLNLLSEAPQTRLTNPNPEPEDELDENPLFVIDRDDFLEYAVYDDFFEPMDKLDFSRFIVDTIKREGKYSLTLTPENLWEDVSGIPARLIKNIAQIQREYPKTYEYIQDNPDYIEDPGMWARVKFVG